MKLSCLPVSFFTEIINHQMSIVEWAQMGARVGLDAIDLSILFIPNHSLNEVAKIRREIETTGMSVVMVTTYPDFTHPQREQRKLELELAKEAIGIADALGARYVRVTAGQAHPETDRDAGIAWAVEGLSHLVEETQESNVTLVYENHGKPGAWHYTDFSQPPAIFLEIAEQVATSGLRINFDTANATAFADNPIDLLEQVIDRVESLHAADTAVRGELQHVLVGTGLVPFEKIFARLKQAAWDGWICIEEASFGGENGVTSAVRFINEAWDAA